ncbi:sigma-70 family RNA polymerase sigma factor [Actinoplanes sp. URMC 104]|uniref:sigma-70 family RNA polymerase sigma factor n=1 Tax=Actinoplanes sp. URMC 104 TaxID=3423409 RepID=UPI003F1CD4EC
MTSDQLPPDAEALRHLHAVHRPVLLAYVTRLTGGDGHRAEDVVQETLLRAWRHPQARNADGRWNRAWLLTVARHIVIDQVRAARTRPPEHLEDRIDAWAGGRDDVERLLDSSEVRAALTALPRRQRDVLVEIFVRERTAEEAAAILDIPAGTVRSRTFYGLRALREALLARGFIGRR